MGSTTYVFEWFIINIWKYEIWWRYIAYVTKVKNGNTASVYKGWDEIFNNFFISNYNADEGVDNDDGSGYYKTHDNFFVYGGNGLKSDFGGHDNHHYNNIYGYLSQHCFGINGQLEGHQDLFYNNTCIINGIPQNNEYGSFNCSTQNEDNQWPKLGDNTVYIAIGNNSKVGLCGKTEDEFQQTYPNADIGTVIKGAPDNAEIIAAAKALIMG